MSETGSHIHVAQNALETGPTARNLVVSMLGRATDAPSVVTTGCGVQVPYAMTSPRPESVTCLPCREHAQREYLRLAEQIDRLGQAGPMPGMNLTGDQLAGAAERLRDLATRFAG